jgi:hypothetical protein
LEKEGLRSCHGRLASPRAICARARFHGKEVGHRPSHCSAGRPGHCIPIPMIEGQARPPLVNPRPMDARRREGQ